MSCNGIVQWDGSMNGKATGSQCHSIARFASKSPKVGRNHVSGVANCATTKISTTAPANGGSSRARRAHQYRSTDPRPIVTHAKYAEITSSRLAPTWYGNTNSRGPSSGCTDTLMNV